jgi:hypothetical protein
MKPLLFDAEIWWLVRADEIRPPAGLPLVEAINRFQDHFRFMKVPSGPVAQGGYEFFEGRAEVGSLTVAVKKLAFFSDGITVQVSGTTDAAQDVFNQAWSLLTEMGTRKPVTAPFQFHTSSIVVDMDRDIDQLVHLNREISDLITRSVDHFATSRVAMLQFMADATKLPGKIGTLNPTSFKIERRFEVEFELNRYFSMANATTDNHLAILKGLERLLQR